MKVREERGKEKEMSKIYIKLPSALCIFYSFLKNT